MEGNPNIFILLKLLLVLLLVMVNGFFVAAEFSLIKIRHTQLDPLVAKGNRRARIARGIVNNLDTVISATQLGITLASLALGALVAPVFEALLRPVFVMLQIDAPQVRQVVSLLVGFLVNTFLIIVAGEIAPKCVAIRQTLATTLWVAQPLVWFYRCTYPFIWLLNWASQWLLRQLGVEAASTEELSHSEEELRLMVAASFRPPDPLLPGRNIVLNALDLRRRVARDVMKPRLEIVGLDTESSIVDCLQLAEKTRYSRFPLCVGGNLDQTIGVVHIKDLYALRLKARKGADLARAARRIIFIPPTARLEKVLQLLQDRRLHFAMVVDEYGGTIGLITLENILEELVGQIQDEFDQEKPPIQSVGQDLWEISGALPLHQLSELVGEPIIEEGVTTTSGLVTQRLGGFPQTGDRLTVGAFELEVLALAGHRVAALRLQRHPQPPPAPPPA